MVGRKEEVEAVKKAVEEQMGCLAASDTEEEGDDRVWRREGNKLCFGSQPLSFLGKC